MRIRTASFRMTGLTLGRMTLLLLMLTLAIPSPSDATTFFDTDFEAGGSFLTNGWDDDGTAGIGHLEISTEQALTGTRSMKGTFTDVGGSSQQPYINHAFPPSAHFFNRFAYRITPGFQFGNNGYTKIMRFKADGGWPIIWLEILHGVYEITVEGPYLGPNGDNYSLLSGIAPSSTSWDQIEFECLLNTGGQANGVLRLWINGVQRINLTGLQLVGPTPSSVGQQGLPNPSNLVFNDNQIFIQSGVGSVYLDRVAIGDTRIGTTAGGGGGGTADITPPAPPSQLRIN